MTGRFTPLESDDPEQIGEYRLRARLGVGGMGRVYLAFTAGGHPVAVKVVRPEYAEDEEFRRRFRIEVAAARQVKSPLYTAPVVGADTEARLPWLATAYIPGPSLRQAVTEHGPLPLPTVFRLLAGVAEGLTAIHTEKLIHRDLKPANVLLAADGPRVIDFGIAHAADATTITSTHLRVGTPAFMAPEQIRGHPASPATDVFALGNLAVYAATGRTAFGEGNPQAMFYRIINEDPDLTTCPKELQDIAQRCLAKDPKRRPPVAEIMHYARRQTEGQTINLAASWLPKPVAQTLLDYQTATSTTTAPDTANQDHTPPADTPPTATDNPTPTTPTYSISWTGEEPLLTYINVKQKLPRWIWIVAILLLISSTLFVGFGAMAESSPEADEADEELLAVSLFLWCICVIAITIMWNSFDDAVDSDFSGYGSAWALHIGPLGIVTEQDIGRTEFPWHAISTISVGTAQYRYNGTEFKRPEDTGLLIEFRPDALLPVVLRPAGDPYLYPPAIYNDLSPVPPNLVCILGPMTERERKQLLEALTVYGGKKFKGYRFATPPVSTRVGEK